MTPRARLGGRLKGDPNICHDIRLTRIAKPANERKGRQGGKLNITIAIPPELYDDIRLEAIKTNQSFNRLALDCLSAGFVGDL